MDLRERWAGLPVLAVGCLLALFSGYDLTTPGVPRLAVDLIGLALAGLMLTVALATPLDREIPPGFASGVRDSRLRWVGLALLALGAAAGGRAAWMLWLNQVEWKPALSWWLAGLLVPLAGAIAFDLGSARLCWAQPSARTGVAALGALVVGGLALFLRVYRLDAVPPGIFIDETNGALDALAILRGSPTSPFATGWYEVPSGYMYVLAGAIGFLGPTLLALKLSGIVNGILAVLGVYLLGRLLFGTPAGLVAGLFLALAQWPLNMSRWGWVETAPPVAHVWAVYFLVRGARSRRATDFALGGLILGLGMYTYLSIRLVLVAIAAYLVYRATIERGFVREHLGRLALFALVWGLTFAPLAVTYARNPQTFLNRSREVTIQRDVERAGWKPDPVVENVRRHLLMFNVEGDHNPRHNLPGKPMLDPAMGALLVVAVARALALGLDHRRGLLLLWIPAILLGGILSSVAEGPQAFRTLGVMPAVAILCGELLARIGQRLAELLPSLRWPRIVATGLPTLGMAGVLAWSGLANFQAYFVAYAADPRVYVAFSPLETAVARELASAPDLDAYYLSSRLFYFSPVRYFTARSSRAEAGRPPAPPYHLFQSPDDLPLPGDGSKDQVLLWEREWSGLANVLRPTYPHLSVEQVPARSGGVLYERVTIPVQDLREVRGLLAKRRWVDGREDQVRVADPAVGLPGDYSQVEWVGSLYVPRSGGRAVWAADGATVLLDGKPATAPSFLPKGLHRLRATQRGDQDREGLRLLWSESGGATGQPVPAANLYTCSPSVANGLLGTYYRGDRWEGPPLFRRVDPVILFGWPEPEPVSGAFSVTWQGEIEIAVAGSYVFLVESDDGARLWLDGEVVGQSMKRGSANFVEARVALAVGRHPIRIDYFQSGGAKGINLRWIPPGQSGTLVPAEVLWPTGR